MAGQTGPNDPRGDKSREEVRELQRQLWAAAKRAPGRRFHALYGQICRDDVLRQAWRRVRSNRGAAGVDKQSIGSVEQYGVDRFLAELAAQLRAGEYGAQAVRRAYVDNASAMKHIVLRPTRGAAVKPRLDGGLANRGVARAQLHVALELYQYASVAVDGVATARVHVQQETVDRGTAIRKLCAHDFPS